MASALKLVTLALLFFVVTAAAKPVKKLQHRHIMFDKLQATKELMLDKPIPTQEVNPNVSTKGT